MSFASHYRTLSPTGGRHHVAGPRASTGMVQIGSYDPHEAPRRYDMDDYYPSDTGYPNTHKYRPTPRSRIEAQPISSQKYRDPGHSTKMRTEYTIQPPSRPRPRSHTASAADLYDTPVRLAVPSSSHLRPVINSSHRSPSPLPSGSNQHLSSHGARHHRVYSNEYASDTGRLEPRDNVKRHSGYRVAHRAAPPTNRRRYPPLEGLKKGDDIDKYDAYSYTTPREQFDRDYPVKPRNPAGRTSSGRPLSMNIGDDRPPWQGHREPREQRPRGPPPTYRGLDKLGREERPYASPRAADDHLDEPKSRDGGHDQALVPVPRDESDDGYDKESDGRRRRRHHRHRYGGDRHSRDSRASRPPNETERSLPLGTAALGSGYSDLSDYDHRPTRRSSRRPQDSGYGYGALQSSPRDSKDGGSPGSEKNKQLYLEPPERRPSRSRSRGHSRNRQGDNDRYTDDEDLQKYRQEPPGGSRRRHSSTDTSSDEDYLSRPHRRDRSNQRPSQRMLEDGRAAKSGYPRAHSRRDEVRSPIAVDPPSREYEPLATRKGILKPPRPSFPEEPNPIREGVAPLKDAHKKGIPPGARWTKIDRRLVNPEALEAGNERFEERSDYVIVLRVLSKEEIQAYAVKTQEVRGQYLPVRDWEGPGLNSSTLTDDIPDTRHKEHVQDRRRRIDDNQRHGWRGEESSSDDEDEGEEPRAQIEAPPPPEYQERMALPMRPRDSNHPMPEPERVRTSPPAAPA